MTGSERPEPPALSALVGLLRESSKQPSAAELEQGLSTLRARVSATRPRARLRVAFALAGVTLLAVAAAFALRLRLQPSPSSSPVAMTRIEGGQVLDGGYLSESGHEGVKLFFNEGSRFLLAPGTRGRLRSVTAEGARVTIDRGTASFSITPSSEHRWSVEAGPFSVAVRGTEFSVSWDPTRERLEVALERGRVAVSGPVLGEALMLRAGQRLSVNLPERETVITEEPRQPSGAQPASDVSASPPAAVAPAAASASATSVAGPRASASASIADAGGKRRWSEALATGAWDVILADVERMGLAETLQTASSRELFALADAARYRRRFDWAKAALMAQRERFPGSPRSVDAAFLLGRVEEGGSSKSQAMKWYDTYLASAPSGTYAAEALGRKLVLTKELLGPESARRIADEYLRRFPNGSYAGTAQAVRGH